MGNESDATRLNVRFQVSVTAAFGTQSQIIGHRQVGAVFDLDPACGHRVGVANRLLPASHCWQTSENTVKSTSSNSFVMVRIPVNEWRNVGCGRAGC
jgi:hypothetical protein